MDFPGILGHERVRGLLSHALRGGRVPPALSFSGPSGVGKKTLAMALGRALLCDGSGPRPCEACSACMRGLKGIHPDLFLVEAVTRVVKIEQVREAVRAIAAGPFEGRARTFVIDDAHAMTEQAQNALLKSLEEPPRTSHIVLVTASPQALLPTIRSRCQTLRFGPLSAAVVEGHLRAALGLGAEEARVRAAAAGGSLGVALALETESFREGRERLLALLEGAGEQGPLDRMAAAEALADHDDPISTLAILRSLLRDVAALRAGALGLVNADLEARLLSVARGPLGERALELAEAAAEAREALEGNANKLLTMDVLLEGLAR